MVRDLDVAEPKIDGRRLEIVVDGLPLFSGAHLAVDTTMVSPVHHDGTARRGAALVVRRSWKKHGEEKSGYLELSRAGGRASSPPQWEGDGLRRLPSETLRLFQV